MLKIEFGDNLLYEINQKWGWEGLKGCLRSRKLNLYGHICNILNAFYAILQFLSILNFFGGWSILKILEKSRYFRYLFLGFKISSLLGEYFDVPCWELRIDVSKSHTHKMIWFIEKIGYFLSRWPIKPFSQIFSLSALQRHIHLTVNYTFLFVISILTSTQFHSTSKINYVSQYNVRKRRRLI